MTISRTTGRALASVFDRRQARHPWQKAFRELMQADPMRRFVCSNWQMDPRVSQTRENEILEAGEFAGEPDGDQWWRQRGDYFFRTLGRPIGAGSTAGTAELQPSAEGNVISRHAIPAHEQLVHVASLNRVLARLVTGEHLTAELRLAFPDLTGRPLPERPVGNPPDPTRFDREVDEIAAAVNRRGLETVRQLAGLLCDAQGDAEPPWWANFAAEVMPRIDRGDWTGLCQALGLGHLEAGEWLIIWRYQVAVLLLTDAAPLRRPTVVEADDNPFYFPSPPGAAYGITMPLEADPRGACREVIHPPLRGRAAVDGCAYELCRLANPPLADPRQLAALRRRHRRRLERQHPQPEAADWLRRHQDLP